MKNFKIFIYLKILFFPTTSYSLIEVDITRGNLDPLPIAVSPLYNDPASQVIKQGDKIIEDIGAEISNVTRKISDASQQFIGQIGNAVQKGLVKFINSGLKRLSQFFFSTLPAPAALAASIAADNAAVGPATALFYALKETWFVITASSDFVSDTPFLQIDMSSELLQRIYLVSFLPRYFLRILRI